MFANALPIRPSSIHIPPPLNPSKSASARDPYSDSRTHGYQGPTRSVCLPHASSSGGGAIARSQDGVRCVVAGRESLRILRLSETSALPSASEHKSAVGKGGHRIDLGRNLWTGSGLKVDSASTDVAWGHANFAHKIFTSARNGELIIWDLNKSGPSKCERRVKDHTRAINKLSYSQALPQLCITGSADGDIRLWDLRDMTKSVTYIHHPDAVRTLVISPYSSNALHAISGLDNGSIYRWDLRKSQRGQLDRLPVAHAGAILSLGWCESQGPGGGWLASAGLDRCVKVWDLSATIDGSTNAVVGHIPAKPTYTLHVPFPVRRIAWRPGFPTELAISSNHEVGFSLPSSPVPAPMSIPSSFASEALGLLSHLSMKPSTSGSSTDDTSASGRGSDTSGTSTGHTRPSGDLIEIWDIRRAYVAKWAVEGSSVEGGVTDMVFGDSHALWTQHPSGAFSQLDLRYSSKPIDSIPRAALSWNAADSLAFVADHPEKWEIPYDDMDPAQKLAANDQKKTKKRGDAPYVPKSQNMGMWDYGSSTDNWQAFANLARSYKIEGADRPELCEVNAQLAFEAGLYEAGQSWLLLQSLLTDLVPIGSSSPRQSASVPEPNLTHPALPSNPSPPRPVTRRSSSSEPRNTSPGAKSSIGKPDDDKSETTPASARPDDSSISSRPRLPPHSLSSPVTPAPRPKSRRLPSQGALPNSGTRRPSLLRSSISSLSLHSESPSDSNKSYASSRHVGDGALDDSDSEGSVNGKVEDRDGFDAHDDAQMVQPSARLRTNTGPALSSPLSKEDNDWAEDERDEDSSFPGSSDTESDDSAASSRPARSSSIKRRPKHRSSGIAFSPVSAVRQSLTRDGSHSSVRTVTGVDTSAVHDNHTEPAVVRGGRAGSERSSSMPSRSQKSKTRRSAAPSVISGHRVPFDVVQDTPETVIDYAEIRFLEKNHKAIEEAERKYRAICWSALRDGLESYSQSGDVQMCAMLSCIAPRELNISRRKAARFVEAYIELLSRLRLHTAAAYLRKYSDSLDIRHSTQLQTTIYTNCGKCRKPIVQPVREPGRVVGRLQSGYSYCRKCKEATIKCSICHLPVRASLFVCPVCSHGGHEECYRRYYMERPMVDLLTSSSVSRGRSAVRGSKLLGNLDDDRTTVDSTPSTKTTVKIVGHPCAAGCGHYCWAANERSTVE